MEQSRSSYLASDASFESDSLDGPPRHEYSSEVDTPTNAPRVFNQDKEFRRKAKQSVL